MFLKLCGQSGTSIVSVMFSENNSETKKPSPVQLIELVTCFSDNTASHFSSRCFSAIRMISSRMSTSIATTGTAIIIPRIPEAAPPSVILIITSSGLIEKDPLITRSWMTFASISGGISSVGDSNPPTEIGCFVTYRSHKTI